MGRMKYKEVIIPGVTGVNLSRPDAKAGFAILEEAKVLLEAGTPGKEVLAKLSVKWGVVEVIEAIAHAMGQDELRRAMLQGRVYMPHAEEEWEDKPT